jgi:hypothetical protein
LNADGGPISISTLKVKKATGTLTKNGSDIAISGVEAGQIAVDPSGRFVFVAGFQVPTSTKTGTVFLFRINGLGRLARNGTIPLDVATPFASGSIAFTER